MIKSTIFVILMLSFMTAGNPIQDQIVQHIQKDIEYLNDFYQHRHLHPEVSLQEKETSKELAEELRKVGFQVTENFGGYGIVGMMKNGDGPTILYRTDMDALPMYEKTELPYASDKTVMNNGTEVGMMHSCGHDMHMTTWVGTARLMAEMKDQWSGTLMMIGQPAEETGEGARMMLENGLYQTFGVPDYGIGLHCSPTIKTGQVGVDKGFTMANAESVDIRIFGVGAHGASPHMSVDPVVIASMMVMELQTIVSRSIKPTETAVVTVGAIKGGTKHNIIPDEVTLQLTLRTYKEEVRMQVHKRIREIARGVAIAAGLPEDKMPEVHIPEEFTPANYNNPELVERFKVSASQAIGDQNVVYAEPQMVAEDFARFGRTEDKVPTVLFWLGTVTDEKIENGNLPGLHSPYYYPEINQTIKTGVSVVSTTLMDLMPAN